MGSSVRYACCGKEMLGRIREKMAILELALGGGMFFTSGSTTLETAPQLAMTRAL